MRKVTAHTVTPLPRKCEDLRLNIHMEISEINLHMEISEIDKPPHVISEIYQLYLFVSHNYCDYRHTEGQNLPHMVEWNVCTGQTLLPGRHQNV